jgi:hypothetical protein
MLTPISIGIGSANGFPSALNKSARVTVAEDVNVTESCIEDRVSQFLWDWDRSKIATALSSRPDPVSEWVPLIVWDSRNGVRFTKIEAYFEQLSRSFPVIVDMQFEMSSPHNKIIIGIYPVARKHLLTYSINSSLWHTAARKISPFDFMSMRQLAFIDAPNCPRENANCGSSESGNDNTSSVKNFENLNEKEWREVIAGALFLAGLGYLAYLTMKGG